MAGNTRVVFVCTDHEDSADAVLIAWISAVMAVETEAEKGPIPTASSRELLMPILVVKVAEFPKLALKHGILLNLPI